MYPASSPATTAAKSMLLKLCVFFDVVCLDSKYNGGYHIPKLESLACQLLSTLVGKSTFEKICWSHAFERSWLNNCWVLINGTVWPISRPEISKISKTGIYNGHKKYIL